MTDLERQSPDAAARPDDPAGTRPRHNPEDLLPARPGAAPAGQNGGGGGHGEVVDAVAFEEPEARLELTEGDGEPADVEIVGERGRREPYAPRFHFLTGALAAIGVAAVFALVGFLVAGGGNRNSRDTSWSAWKPGGNGSASEQIADHVGARYRLADGHQLVLVQGGPLEVADLPLTVALREAPSQGGDIKLFDGKSVLYRLCGLGAACSIASGKPSIARGLLLHREALELALYSFRYLDGLDQVVVFMPPPPGEQPSTALFFRRGQLASRLDKPLSATLTGHVPSVKGVRASADASVVSALTSPTLFSFSLVPANQDDQAFLVLDPPAVTTTGSGSGDSTGSGSSGSGSDAGTGTGTVSKGDS